MNVTYEFSSETKGVSILPFKISDLLQKKNFDVRRILHSNKKTWIIRSQKRMSFWNWAMYWRSIIQSVLTIYQTMYSTSWNVATSIPFYLTTQNILCNNTFYSADPWIISTCKKNLHKSFLNGKSERISNYWSNCRSCWQGSKRSPKLGLRKFW